MPGTLNVLAVFCLILTAKINAIPGGDSKESIIAQSFHFIWRPQNQTKAIGAAIPYADFWLLNFFLKFIVKIVSLSLYR